MSSRNPLNLKDVFETSMTTQQDQKRLTVYFSTLQDNIRRMCNNNSLPNPLIFTEERNVQLVNLDPAYETHIECIREIIAQLETDIPNIRRVFLNWL